MKVKIYIISVLDVMYYVVHKLIWWFDFRQIDNAFPKSNSSIGGPCILICIRTSKRLGLIVLR